MSTFLDLDILELEDIDLSVPCNFKNYKTGIRCPNNATWILFVVMPCGCHHEQFVCDLHHDVILQDWDEPFFDMACSKCGASIFVYSYSSVIIRIERL